MARRGGFERVLRASARELGRQLRLAEAEQRRRAREVQRAYVIAEREAVRAQKEMDQLAKRLYLESREAEALEANIEVADRVADLARILERTLEIDDTISFSQLRVTQAMPAFRIPPNLAHSEDEPSLVHFTRNLKAPSGFLALIPGARRRFEKAFALAERSYVAEHTAWKEAEDARQLQISKLRAEHDKAAKALEEKRALRNAEVDDFERSYRTGDPDAIVAYVGMVLENSSYPDGFPQVFSIAYQVASKQLILEYELPLPDLIPATTEFRYVKSRDQIISKDRKLSEIKSMYSEVISATALRTIHEVFESDQAAHISICCFNGYVSTVDPATGRDIRPHLISVRATKEAFSQIDLARVEKSICLKTLGAQISRSATEAQPVRPLVEFNMADARFVDQHDLLNELGSAPNLMDLSPGEFEQLVANLFGEMGLEAKLTRTSKDGGVDCVAYDPRPVLGGKVVVQAKRYRHTVGVSAVRDLFGTMSHEGANKGILVTTSGYGPDAFEFARDKPIELIEGSGLLFLLQEIGVKARIVMPHLA